MCEKRTYKERLKQEAVIAQVKRRREMWREMMIENEGSLINKVMNGQFAGKRPRGRPRKRWRDEILSIVPLHFDYFVQYVDYVCITICSSHLGNCRMHCVETTPTFGNMFVKIDRLHYKSHVTHIWLQVMESENLSLTYDCMFSHLLTRWHYVSKCVRGGALAPKSGMNASICSTLSVECGSQVWLDCKGHTFRPFEMPDWLVAVLQHTSLLRQIHTHTNTHTELSCMYVQYVYIIINLQCSDFIIQPCKYSQMAA